MDKRALLSFGDFIFEYKYFQWLKKVLKRYAYENITFHGQLHAVFYDSRYDDFINVLAFDYIAILSFDVKINSLALNKYEELYNNLKLVRYPDTQTVMKNVPLTDWLNVFMDDFGCR